MHSRLNIKVRCAKKAYIESWEEDPLKRIFSSDSKPAIIFYFYTKNLDMSEFW